MNHFLLFVFFLTCEQCFGQHASLQFNLEYYDEEPVDCYRLIFTAGADTLSDCVLSADDLFGYEIRKDSLAPNPNCKVSLYDCRSLENLLVARYFRLDDGMLTRIDLHNEGEIGYWKITGERKNGPRIEHVVSISSFNNRWLDPTSLITYNGEIGVSQYSWRPFSKHIGFMGGGGFSLSHYAIAKDTSFTEVTQWKKQYEYYNYLSMNFDIRLRFSLGLQNNPDIEERLKALLDVGVKYNLPLIFRHTARYDGFRKTSRGGLHQFTDARLYVNLGWEYAGVFVEYRLFNFLKGNYPEVPKISFGLRAFIHD